MTIFLLLNGCGVVFLFYVMVNFWKEGRQDVRGKLQPHRLLSRYGSAHQVLVVSKPIEMTEKRRNTAAVMPFYVGKNRGIVAAEGAGHAEDKTLLVNWSSR